MMAVDGGYDLFYSANNWDSADYAIGVARCSGVLGPCSKPLAGPCSPPNRTSSVPGGRRCSPPDRAYRRWPSRRGSRVPSATPIPACSSSVA